MSDVMYSALPKVMAVADALGITQEHLLHMIKYSSRITHEHGNRRFHNYLFNVVERGDVMVVESFTRLDKVPILQPSAQAEVGHFKCQRCHDTKQVKVFDECPRCDGERWNKIKDVECEYCNGEGFIPTMIACQDCATKKL